ncbi:MAG: thymidine phosphorylase [Alphaproteobacteria bacterium]|nr:MAG: thymidine phosphorylase [Alphaproteobacteria bacterium]
MKFKVKKFVIHSGFSVFFHEDAPIVQNMKFDIQPRIIIKKGKKSAVVNVGIINQNTINPKEIILSQETYDAIGAKSGDIVTAELLSQTFGLGVIKKRLQGDELTYEDYLSLYKSFLNYEVFDLHVASFVTASTCKKITNKELIASTKAMLDLSQKISWPYDIIVDKHCIGGVAGNRTTPVIVSIVAAFGLAIPKTSSKAITSPAGTADTMSVITNVEDLDIKKIVKKEKGCFAFGGNVNPVDNIIIKIERMLELNIDSQLIASIMSKKLAAGSTHTLLDIPVGPETKIKTKAHANYLKRAFEMVAKHFGVKVKVYISDGTKPIGRGIGPSLEIKDVLKVLKNDPEAPKDLREKCIKIAGMIIDFVEPKKGCIIAKQILKSGQAFEKFKAICKAQGAYKPDIEEAKIQRTIYFKKSGVLEALSNKKIVTAAKMAGAPLSLTAGLYLHKNVGEPYKKNDAFVTIHTVSEDMADAVERYLKENCKDFT